MTRSASALAPLPLAVIGGGAVGLRHAEVAMASPLVTLTAVVETDAARRDALAARGLPVAAGPEGLRDTRAAIVATPTPVHRETALDALARGWAVLVEKPLAGSLADARAILAEARARNLPLVTGHHRRCHPFALAARQALGAVGAPVGVQGLWSLRKHEAYFEVPWRTRPGAGPLLTNLSHELDLMAFLLGPIEEVAAFASSARRGLAIEDTAALALRFANGALGSFLISDAGASPWAFEAATGENPDLAVSGEDSLRIVGTEGALAFPSLTCWTAAEGAAPDWRRPMARAWGQDFARIDPLREQLDRFARLVAGGRDDVLARGADGLAALEMTLATALAARTGRAVARGSVPEDFDGD